MPGFYYALSGSFFVPPIQGYKVWRGGACGLMSLSETQELARHVDRVDMCTVRQTLGWREGMTWREVADRWTTSPYAHPMMIIMCSAGEPDTKVWYTKEWNDSWVFIG